MDNLRIFQNGTEYSAATINRPSVSWIKDTDKVVYDPYIPPYKLKVKYSDNTSYNKICDSSTDLSQSEVRGGTGAYSAITDAEIGDCVTNIISGTSYNGAFTYCTSLSSVTIPNSVTTIGQYAFSHCTSLSSVTIPNSVTTIGQYAFYDCTSLSSIDIPSGITSIEGFFSVCTSLSSVTIPNSVTTIGQYAFQLCSSLPSIDIPNSVRTIGSYAFDRCTSLSSVTIPDSVYDIGVNAFWGCSSLTSIELPSGVTSIGSYAFAGCSNLSAITVNATTPPTLYNNDNAFDSTNNCPIYVPSESVSAYQSSWSAYSSRIQAIPSPTPTAFTWTTIDDTFVGEQTPIPVYEIHIDWATTDDASESFGFWDNPSFTGNGNYSCIINFDENSGLYELEIQQYPNWTTVYSHSYSSSTDINIDFIDVFGKPMYFNSAPLEYGDCISEECMQYECNQYECDDWDSETGECIHEYCAEEGPCIDYACMEYQRIYISTAKIEQTS